jgi:hypothetical protein
MSLRLLGLHLALASLASLLAGPIQAAPEPEPDAPTLSPADRALLEGFDRFGLPSFAGTDYVRVWTGQVQQGCCRGRSELSRYGFLIEETETEFKIVHDLWPVTYVKAPALLPPGARAPRYEKAEFKDVALKRTRRGFKPGRLSWENLIKSRARPSACTEFVFLARAAWQQGNVGAARDLMVQARTGSPSGSQRGHPTSSEGKQLEDTVARELPLILLWSAIQSCGEASVDRATLLDRFRMVGTHFPGAASVADAQEFSETLERMAREDAEHATPSATARDLELDTRLHELRAPVERLVYELRDLRAPHTFRHRPAQRHLNDPKSASSRLLALGPVATRALIDLCEDRRLTRVLNPYARRGPASACVFRYGDIALQILSRQAGRTFTTKAEAAAWWSKVEEHGEIAVLERMILEGLPDSIALARKLRALDPERAISTIMTVANTVEGRDRERVVSYIASQKGPRVDAFLLEEVHAGKELRARLTAARTLERRGTKHWSEPLVGELTRLALAGQKRDRRTSRDLIRFVVPSGSLYALEALRRNYSSFSVDERRNLLECAARVPRNRSDRSMVCEAILVEALADSTHWPHSWSQNGVRCVDAKLSEISAVLLAARLGETFDPTAPPYARARRIAELRNSSLTACGLPPAPLPDEPTLPPVEDPLELEAALFHLRAASSFPEIEAATERLRAVGLPALTRLRELIDAATLDPAAQGNAEGLLNTLASTVREVQVTDAIGRLTDATLADLRSLIGKPLRGEALVKLIQTQLAGGDCLLRVSMHRDGQGRGVALKVDLRNPIAARHPARVVYALRANTRVSRSSLSLGTTKQAKSGWARFRSRLDNLLCGNARIDGELRLRVGTN